LIDILNPPADSEFFDLTSTIHHLGGAVKECDELYMLGHREEVKYLQQIQRVSAS
jgi:hypothetical protein